MGMQEILATYGVEYPKIPGKKFRAFEARDAEGVTVTVEVTADGATEPEWSAEGRRLEPLVARARKHYGLNPVEPEAGE